MIARALLLCLLLALNHGALQDLLQTDTGGHGPTLASQMALAAYHGYPVNPEGVVELQDGSWRIAGDGRLEAVV